MGGRLLSYSDPMTPAIQHKGKLVALRSANARGFTYIGLLIMIAIIGVAAAATLQLGQVLQRREAEQELLAIGGEFRAALISYASATPAGQSSRPQSLEDLLRDPRYPNIRRHLRKMYADPMTGKSEWGIVKSPDGSGIVGVHSLSTAAPIKIGNFEAEFQYLSGRVSYVDWIFYVDRDISNSSNIGGW